MGKLDFGIEWKKFFYVVVAFVMPPAAVIMCDGFKLSLLVNCFFCCCIWIPGMLHAMYIVGKTKFQEPDYDSEPENKV